MSTTSYPSSCSVSTSASRTSGSSSTTRIGPLRPPGGITVLRLQRQLDRERRTVAGDALHPDLPSVRLDDVSRDPQSEPEPAVLSRPFGALESLEDLLLVLGRDADPAVRHAQHRAGTLDSRLDLDRPPLAVLQRVRDQVGDHLLQADAVPHALDGIEVERDLAAGFRRQVREAVHDVPDHLVESHPLPIEHQPAGVDAGDVEDLADELLEPRSGGRRLLQALLDLRILDAGAAGEALYLHEQRGERRAQLVPGGGEELVAQRDGELRLAQPLRLGEVAGDLGETDVAAFLIEQRRDDDVGPELRAVLADPVALLLISAFRDRPAQLVGRVIAAARVLRIEDGEVFSDDLLRLVPLEALGADVPARDVAALIEHEDGVVADRFDHQAEPLLALAVGLVRVAQLGDVPGHLRKSNQPAFHVAQRGDGDVRPEPLAVLADPPSLLAVAPLANGDLELALRLAGGFVLFRVEDREVLSDDLLGLISLDSLRTRVPGRNRPVLAEHEDRVVVDAVDEFLEPIVVVARTRGRSVAARLAAERLDSGIEGRHQALRLVDRMAAQTARTNPEPPTRRHGPEQLGSEVPAVRKLLIAERVRRARSFVRVSGVGRHARSHVGFLRNRRNLTVSRLYRKVKRSRVPVLNQHR